MIGANDAQDFLGPPDTPYASPAVERASTRSAWRSSCRSPGAPVPPSCGSACHRCRTPVLNAQMADLNTIVKQQAAARQAAGHLRQHRALLGTRRAATPRS